MTIPAETYRARQTEAEFQAAVIDLARLCGWLVVHIRSMVANPSGLPDLLMWREHHYLLVELKTERGKISDRQRQWHERAQAHGVTVCLWRPSDFETIEMTLRGEG